LLEQIRDAIINRR